MKTCTNCKTDNSDDAHFCMQCENYLRPAARKCPNGHTMDLVWTECPYCKNQSGPQPVAEVFRHPTELDESRIERSPNEAKDQAAKVSPSSQAPASPSPGLEQDAQARAEARRKRLKTEYWQPGGAPADADAPASQKSGAARKIVGVLASYTWKPEGQVFFVREGRNLIGRDEENCDIAIPQDPTLSSVNSHISFRRSFVVGDMVSLSGTDLNGVPIEEGNRALPNYSTIRTGSTVWTFVMLERGN